MLTGQVTQESFKEEPPAKGLPIGRLCPGKILRGGAQGFHTTLFQGGYSLLFSSVKYPGTKTKPVYKRHPRLKAPSIDSGEKKR